MKVSRIAVLAATLILGSGAAFAQRGQPVSTPQQWTIVTTSETAPNATPTAPAPSAPNPCTTGQNDNPKDSNPNCFNPLTVTTDWTVANSGRSPIFTAVAANTFSNSNCSADGGVQAIVVTGFDFGGWYQTTVEVTVLDGNGNPNTITFTGSRTHSSTQFTGNFTSTGTCMNGDQGTFSATLFPTINGTYSGSFESNGTPFQSTPPSNGQVTITFNTDSNFNITGSVAAAAGAGLCFSNLTIATPLADSYSPSVASGDVLLAVATDNSGNVVVFVASGTDGNGQQLGSDQNGNQKLYLTYVGLAGACSGISGVDVPFTKIVPANAPPHRPIGPVRFGRLIRSY